METNETERIYFDSGMMNIRQGLVDGVVQGFASAIGFHGSYEDEFSIDEQEAISIIRSLSRSFDVDLRRLATDEYLPNEARAYPEWI